MSSEELYQLHLEMVAVLSSKLASDARQLSIAIPKRLTIGSILQEIGSQPFLASELVRFTEGAGNKRQDWSAIDQKGEGTLENRGHGNLNERGNAWRLVRDACDHFFPRWGIVI